MLTAGSDSTSGAMGYFFISIMRNPQWIPKIMAEIDAAPLGENGLITAQTVRDTMPIFQACMKETLRLYTGRDFQRVAPEDVELKGHLIPAGAEVNVSRYGLHRGPWWAEPDAFKPERFLGAGSEGAEEPGKAEELMKGAYAPFSLGVRDCIGKNFAWQVGLKSSQKLIERS
jgi:cytochrome P450